ncbi:radial spoke head 10 homolog B [Thalassophryne amazonica]|uniref:radial spoke head 10 homolog B n=1 Tax=Thalassophryne amazonica TaxID=390379 RepID=UPI001471798F|nr:radial spoke head 10 homolog B [Thalassophryne amazonica]
MDGNQPNLATCASPFCKKNEEMMENLAICRLIVHRYEGETCEGELDGEGVAYFQGGHFYKGVFSKGLMHGCGVFEWAGGLKYEGEFVSNNLMGRGTYTWPDGSSYQGEVYNGVRHGTGTSKCGKSGVVYRGQWHRGARHGKGAVFYNQDQTSWYKGDWVKNNREGWGDRLYPSGNVYSGEWKNNVTHGAGTMKWVKLGQQYVGSWQNGVQHGRGTHVWFLKRVDGIHYYQSNQYTGEFVEGQRHGQGTFYYAGGAIYEGEWKNNKKCGQGKYTLQSGNMFEGEFVDDQMLVSNLPGNKAKRIKMPGPDSSILGPHMVLNIGSLLETVAEKKQDTEREQVEFVVLQNITELKSMYRFYSKLCESRSPDKNFLLSRLQLWRLLKDCNVHHHDVTLSQIDLLITEDATSSQIHSPFTSILFCGFLRCLVIVAYHIYHKDMESQKNVLAACFSRLMTDDVLPNAKNVKGFLFNEPGRSEDAVNYMSDCWEVYQDFCRCSAAPRTERTMTYRHLLWMFKDLDLLDSTLTTAKLLQIINAESRDPSNQSSCLNLEITFLEFFEVLLGCAQLKCSEIFQTQGGPRSPPKGQHNTNTKANMESPEESQLVS